MSSFSNLGNLPSLEWNQLQELADRLADTWNKTGSVDLNELLPPPTDRRRPLYLVELIKTDLQIRWKRKQEVRLDFYVEKYPELGAITGLKPDLIYEEYRARHLYGDKPDFSTYRRRFPQQYEEFKELVRKNPVQASSPATAPVPAPAPASRPSVGAMSSSKDSNNVVTVEGGYKLLERIGRGTFGEVFKAEAPGGFPVAVKVIFRRLEEDEAQQELKSMGQTRHLSHTFLLQTHAYWVYNGQLHIAMDLAEGTLRQRLKECKAKGLTGIPLDELLGYMRDSADALDYLHSKNLTHRDIKPDNLLIKGGRVRVGDFGLVRFQNTVHMVSATGVVGTPLYMAPEMVDHKISPHSDQYCLAMTYGELRLGKPVFSGKNPVEVMLKHVHDTPDLAPLPPAEKEVLLRALAKAPDKRYPSCTEFVKALRAATRTHKSLDQDSSVNKDWVRPGQMAANGYQLVRPLSALSGHGASHGELWEATSPRGKQQALRVIRNLDYRGLQAVLEAFQLSQVLDHEHLLKVHEYCLTDSGGLLLSSPPQPESRVRVTLLVAEEMASETLAQHVLRSSSRASGEPVSPLELLRYLRQAAEALDYLNQQPHPLRGQQVYIRHCAVNPRNLLLVGDTELKLGDLSQARPSTGPACELSGDNTDLSPGYSAPEMFDKPAAVTDTSDQYSLAVTYYELRTGTKPFDGSRSGNDLINDQLEGRVELSRLHPREREVFKKATSRDPKERYPSCQKMIDALERACTPSSPVLAENVKQGEKTRPTLDSEFIVTLDHELEGKRGGLLEPASGPELSDTDNSTNLQTLKPTGSKPDQEATWKKSGVTRTLKQAATAAPARPLPWKTIAKVAAAAVVVAGLGVGGKFAYQEYTSHTSLAAALRRLLDEKKWDEAIAQLIQQHGNPDGLAPEFEELQNQVPKDKYREWIEKLIAAKKFQEALKTASDFNEWGWIDANNRDGYQKRISHSNTETIEGLIADGIATGNLADAKDKLDSFKKEGTPTDTAWDTLNKKIVDAWVELAQKEKEKKHYQIAKTILDSLLVPYNDNSAALALRVENDKALLDLKGIKVRLDKELKDGNLKEADELICKIGADYPEESAFAESSRSEILTKAKSAVDEALDKTREAKGATQAVDAFTAAHAKARVLDGLNPKAGYVKKVLGEWARYAESLVENKPEEAKDVAEKLAKADTNSSGTAKKILDSAAKALEAKSLGNIAGKIRDSISKLQSEAGDGKLDAAQATISDIVKELEMLPEEQRGGAEKACSHLVLELARNKEAKAVAPLVGKFDKYSADPENKCSPEARSEMTLAKVALQRREKNFADARNSLRGAPDDLKKLNAAGFLREEGEICLEDPKTPVADLEEVAGKLWKERKTFAGQIDGIFGKLVDTLAGRRIPSMNDSTSFKNLIPLCQDALETESVTALTRACLAESLVMQYLDKDGELPAVVEEESLSKARTALATSEAKDHYTLFVRGLLAQAGARYSEAAGQYALAFSAEKSAQEPWQTPLRRKLAASSNFQAGREAKDPEQSYAFYRAAVNLHPEAPLAYRLKYAESAFKAKHYEESDATSESLLKRPGLNDKDFFALADISIKSRTEEKKPAEALKSYDRVIRRWLDDNKLPSEDKDNPVGYFQRFIQPALKLVQEVGNGFADKPLLARMHYAKGKIILDNRYEDWNFPRGPFAEAADSFSRAVELYPGRDKEKAKYIALHGYALAALPHPDLEAMSKDADTALEIQNDEMNGLTLKGLCSYFRAVGASGEDQIKYAQDSISTFREAIKVAKEKGGTDGLIAYNHIEISDVNVLLANSPKYKKNEVLMAAALKEAREHGEKATQLQPKNPRTWWTLGNALEDLAWSRLGKQPDQFPESVKAFETQIRRREAAPEGYLNLARVYVKWAQDDRQAPAFKTRLAEARKNLKIALEKKSSNAEAHYWLGALELLEGKKDPALKAFAKAISDPNNPRRWLYTIRDDDIDKEWKQEERVKAWEDLFAQVLPTGQPTKPDQAVTLLMRAEMLFAFPEIKKDLQRLKGLIADVDRAAELAKANGKTRGYALSWSAALRWAAEEVVPEEQKGKYNDEAFEQVREMLKADPNIDSAHTWAGRLAQWLEGKSSKEGLPAAAKSKLLRESIEYADLAVKKAPESEKKELRENLGRLKQALRDLGASPNDG